MGILQIDKLILYIFFKLHENNAIKIKKYIVFIILLKIVYQTFKNLTSYSLRYCDFTGISFIPIHRKLTDI